MNEPKLLVMRLVDASTHGNTVRFVYRVNDRRVAIEIDPYYENVIMWDWRVYADGEHEKSGKSHTMNVAHMDAIKFIRDIYGEVES